MAWSGMAVAMTDAGNGQAATLSAACPLPRLTDKQYVAIIEECAAKLGHYPAPQDIIDHTADADHPLHAHFHLFSAEHARKREQIQRAQRFLRRTVTVRVISQRNTTPTTVRVPIALHSGAPEGRYRPLVHSARSGLELRANARIQMLRLLLRTHRDYIAKYEHALEGPVLEAAQQYEKVLAESIGEDALVMQG